jgi:hypothetical protein
MVIEYGSVLAAAGWMVAQSKARRATSSPV